MRVIIDAQACQTESRFRGIGRYSADLTSALLSALAGDEVMLGIDGNYPQAAMHVASFLGAGLPGSQTLRYYYPGPTHPHGHPEDGLRPIAERIVRASYASVSADVVHVNSLFEGFVESAAGLGSLTGLPGTLSSATLYDLIPLRFPKQYLVDPTYRAWYERKLEDLSRFDILLCISESTKRDAMELLGIPESRLAVIHAGVSKDFKPPADLGATRARIGRRFGIHHRFVLYTGNDDYRKNLVGALEAFSKLPKSARMDVQLVLNQVDDVNRIQKIARSFGLKSEEVIITGHVSNEDLVSLLQSCDAVFFPSRYEGFGLPLLEGMACGAPVIAANNSSLPEVIGRTDALFDVASVHDMARCLERVLTDKEFSESLRTSGPVRAAQFTWEECARRTLQAWKQALSARNRLTSPLQVTANRRRIAFVSPLPPEQSGIADYAAEILPSLAKLADVEVFTTANLTSFEGIRVHPWKALRAESNRFDQVVYQFGNSPFHSYMVDLIKDVPGLVVLHDFYLSSMFWHMECHEGFPGVFREQIEAGHGRKALQLYETDDAGKMETRRKYPASRSIIEAADAIVVHSNHSLALCRAFYPGIRRGPWSVLPMPIARQGNPGDAAHLDSRRKLRIATDEVLLVSLGFMADTKRNLELLRSLRLLDGAQVEKMRVVFVGQSSGGAYGELVRGEIADHPHRDRILVTEFVSAATYRDYLSAADIAVQLRAESRGETSKAVLDCMAHGLALIVNAHGSLAELPEDAVVKVPDAFTVAELARAIGDLVANPQRRAALSKRAASHIEEFHSTRHVALEYLGAIETSIANRHERTGKALVKPIVDGLLAGGCRDHEYQAIEHALMETVEAGRPGRLLVDLSEVVHKDYGTGIHRVVRNLARELARCDAPLAGPVRLVAHGADGAMTSQEKFGHLKLGLPALNRELEMSPCNVQAGDDLFLLDSAWENPERYLATLEKIRAKGGRSMAMVYDLIPIRHPQYCVEFMPKVFEHWLRFVVRECDVIICISRTVADDLAAWIGSSAVEHRPGLAIGHNLLGSDLEGTVTRAKAASGNRIRGFLDAEGTLTVMVGTVEPRKRHDLVLDAFETLWREGSAQRLLIIGKAGWNVESLKQRLQKHPEIGKRLVWLVGATDSELAEAYGVASRVLMASDAEGFGLPIIEAARHARPLLLSDIPVFREIAGDAADYFQAGSLHALVEALRAEPRPLNFPADRLRDWAHSARSFLKTVHGKDWDFVYPKSGGKK